MHACRVDTAVNVRYSATLLNSAAWLDKSVPCAMCAASTSSLQLVLSLLARNNTSRADVARITPAAPQFRRNPAKDLEQVAIDRRAIGGYIHMSGIGSKPECSYCR
ncbi:hypothetical protein B0H11DRAFT_1899615 [Mycena galericulata]|nr:hypothetical protein B0H11DRAFT_1899615 [Mycena galericulata]